jgi:hypothetical protein
MMNTIKKSKTTLVLFIFALASLAYTIEKSNQTDYNEGWEDGFCEGWKDEKGQFAICPITPIAPIPKLNCMEGYKCGYNRGFKYGLCKAMGRSNCKK